MSLRDDLSTATDLPDAESKLLKLLSPEEIIFLRKQLDEAGIENAPFPTPAMFNEWSEIASLRVKFLLHTYFFGATSLGFSLIFDLPSHLDVCWSMVREMMNKQPSEFRALISDNPERVDTELMTLVWKGTQPNSYKLSIYSTGVYIQNPFVELEDKLKIINMALKCSFPNFNFSTTQERIIMEQELITMEQDLLLKLKLKHNIPDTPDSWLREIFKNSTPTSLEVG
jgi:hypothetical protein